MPDFRLASGAIADLGHDLHARGWVPATSGNFSARVDDGGIAITASGRDKSRLCPEDIILLNEQGQASGGTPSAETGLHLQLYRRDPAIGAVLHTHSLNSVLAARKAGVEIHLAGLELLKAFPGVDSHLGSLAVPVFDNDQDIERLAAAVESHMQSGDQGHAYLIRGHGLYTWGEDIHSCLMQLEAMEFLLEYYLKMEAGKD